MRGVALEFYEVNNLLEMPSNPKVGALYFVKDYKLIIVNHGGGQVVTYASTNADSITGVLPIEKGGTGVGSLEDIKNKFGITNIEAELEQSVSSLNQSIVDGDQFLNDKIIMQAQNTIVLTQEIISETNARQAADGAIMAAVDAVSGKLRYIQANDFGTATPTTEDLSGWAMQYTGLDHVQPGTTIVNEYDSSTWVYDDETGIWNNIGITGVSQATNESLGVIKGDSITEGAASISPAGTVILPIASDNKAGLIRARIAPIIYNGQAVIGVDADGKAYLPALTDDIINALRGASLPSSGNNFATKQDVSDSMATWNK